MAIHISVIGLSTSPRVIIKIACPSAWGQATYVSGRLIDKPKVPMPNTMVDYKPRDVGIMSLSAGHSCVPTA